MTPISEVMTRDVHTLSPDDSVVRAAQAMDELDVGSIPVFDGEKLVGMVTDRDIVLRAVARHISLEQTRLDQIMTPEVTWCFDDQSVDEVMATMCDARIRRLPVIDRDRRLVGIVALGDLASKGHGEKAGEALELISGPSARDRSGQSGTSEAADGDSASDQARGDQITGRGGGAPGDGKAGVGESGR